MERSPMLINNKRQDCKISTVWGGTCEWRVNEGD
jgi:hypothetical protein